MIMRSHKDFVANEIMRLAEFHSCDTVVEYGDGTKTTEKIIFLSVLRTIWHEVFGQCEDRIFDKIK